MKNILTVIFAVCIYCFAFAQKPAPAGVQTFTVKGKTVKVFTTAQQPNLKIAETGVVEFAEHKQPVETEVCVFVDPQKKFQTLLGIGGALTDASAEVFAKLTPAKQEELIQAYYDKDKGIGYTFARTNMNSCDFSSGSYTYVDENDAALKSFSINHDMQYRIPMIKRALAMTKGQMKMFISPWSPPAWMKDNNDMLHGGKLLPKYYQSWANYFVKYIREYEKAGIPIWGLTVQNEPMAKQTWESCIYSSAAEAEFVKKFLGPTLVKSGLASKKLMVWDHNRDLIYQRAHDILNDKEAAKYIWGVGYHWYEDWSGGEQLYQNLQRVKESFPNMNLVFTEGCLGPFDMKKIYDWNLGETYGRSMINDFNNGTVAWTDWNVLLDEQGGPNHVGNFCFAPVHANTRNSELIYTNEYYYIGHFSKFIRPGARRITSVPSRSSLITTAFQNPDGKIAVVVMNQSAKEVTYHLWIAGMSAKTVIPAHAISTLIVQ